MHGEWLRKPTGTTTVVFVHGILSSGEKCWQHANGAYWPELLNHEPDLFMSTPIRPVLPAVVIV